MEMMIVQVKFMIFKLKKNLNINKKKLRFKKYLNNHKKKNYLNKEFFIKLLL
jgi:hypothetical protein